MSVVKDESNVGGNGEEDHLVDLSGGGRGGMRGVGGG